METPRNQQSKKKKKQKQSRPEGSTDEKTSRQRQPKKKKQPKGNKTKNRIRKGPVTDAPIHVKPLVVNDATRWKPVQKDNESNENRDARLVRLLLNKLTPSNFDKLYQEFVTTTTIHESSQRLQYAIQEIVTRAALDDRYATTYAKLCAKLSSNLPKQQAVLPFRDALVLHCVDEIRMRARLEGIDRQRYMGTKRVIGELYNLHVLTLPDLLVFLDMLLQQTEHEINEVPLEGLCVILETCGKSLDTLQKHDGQEDLLVYWEFLQDFANKKHGCVSFRMTHIVRDLLELRSCQWQPVRYGARQRMQLVAKPLRAEDRVVCRKAKRKGNKGKQVNFQ